MNNTTLIMKMILLRDCYGSAAENLLKINFYEIEYCCCFFAVALLVDIPTLDVKDLLLISFFSSFLEIYAYVRCAFWEIVYEKEFSVVRWLTDTRKHMDIHTR